MLCLFTHPWYSKILNSTVTFFHKSYQKDDCNKVDTRKRTKESTPEFEKDRGEGEYNKDLKNHEFAEKMSRKMTMHLFLLFRNPNTIHQKVSPIFLKHLVKLKT